MHVTYDPAVDAGYATLSREPAVRTERLLERLLVDYDSDGRIVGCELLDASAPLDLAMLRAAPAVKEPLRRIHDKARQGSQEVTERFLAKIAADRGSLEERRLRVAAHVRPDEDLALVMELRRKGLLLSAPK